MFLNLKKNKFSEIFLWFFVFVFIFFGFFGFYYFIDKILIIRYSFISFFLFISYLLFLKTNFGIICLIYYNESKIEFKKIIWPTKKDILYTVGIVSVMILVVILCLFFVDFFISKIVIKILGYNNGK